jgi:hypothetical protein
MNLDKPMVVLKKNVVKFDNITADDSDEENKDTEMNEDDKLNERNSITEYLVKAIIRKKILFNKRPRPIVFECSNSNNLMKKI